MQKRIILNSVRGSTLYRRLGTWTCANGFVTSRLPVQGFVSGHQLQGDTNPFSQRHFSTKTRRRGGKLFEEKQSAAPPPAVRPEDAWQPVVDKSSGQQYWWNTITNETTALGAPKPTTASLQVAQPTTVVQYERPTVGQTIKEGLAFGAGAGIAHGIIGSIFGGGSHGSSGGDDGGDSGDFI